MKKLASISLLFFYLLGIGGVNVHSFYCCGEIASVRITYTPPPNQHSPKDTNNNCCNNVTHFFKIHDAQQAATTDFSFTSPVLQVPMLSPSLVLIIGVEQTALNHSLVSQFPPERTALPLFIRNESFLI